MRVKPDGTLWVDVSHVNIREDVQLAVCSKPGCQLHALPGRQGCFGHDDRGRVPHPRQARR